VRRWYLRPLAAQLIRTAMPWSQQAGLPNPSAHQKELNFFPDCFCFPSKCPLRVHTYRADETREKNTGCFCITLQLWTSASCRHQDPLSESEVTPSAKAKTPSGSNSNSEPAVTFNFTLDLGYLDVLRPQLVRLPKHK